jgi:hypothetical protein
LNSHACAVPSWRMPGDNVGVTREEAQARVISALQVAVIVASHCSLCASP